MVEAEKENAEKLAAVEARADELQAELKRLRLALSTLEARTISDDKKILQLSQAYV